MAAELEVLDAAADEAREAARWYAERNPLAAAAFELEVRHAFHEITETPDSWPTHVEGTRRFLLHRFPYEIVYRLLGASVLVLTVAHCKRRPGYWRERAV